MNKAPFRSDERTISLIRKICTRFYFVTMVALCCILLYRQLLLGQPLDELNDLAMLVAANIILWIGGALYYGGLGIGRVRALPVILIYLVFATAGTIFTAWKYGSTTFGEIAGHFVTVATVSAGLVAIWAILAYLGQRRMDRQLSD
jgi:hypothetical protein